jgi:hypothetical protein
VVIRTPDFHFKKKRKQYKESILKDNICTHIVARKKSIERMIRISVLFVVFPLKKLPTQGERAIFTHIFARKKIIER